MSFVTEVEVRFRDHDSFGHVNNAVYATYCEQARVGYFEKVMGVPLSDPHIVVAHLELDYRAPIEGVGTAEVKVEAGEIGGKSFPLYYEISYEGEVVATGETVQVAMDEAGRPTRVPDSWREAIAAHP
ncbi:acyl-CoA thioesterase [Haloferax mediterranei ATCC 33500]|uniref:Thioesterase n=1 Tax=Haloferax mediterranei (strain ATCC 33500 / DSM 1411 / JCM 8866 / NBRC 14739 / NCIMB 2177 / R-4) TaxID=523841 RepID=I3R5K6_HALMT|nr:thioesterase family protein [Haloferax mediterranei]AFK19516.1 putative thioesterase [Haloferax mediterranei ATCC 33500]AHZ21143.1 thioesterase [Haloferax mediterranei ATCC 33500]EMA04297.1 putative thioesterase [Haloferax mediterranei ATCC 33500]MDX5989619.1 thioesterase family protein [Haloferax mediterranei ATCC 33500]QCQ75973.1 acyl-CoA thioesterase [Haloferax mediterranei ATCC 33500]